MESSTAAEAFPALYRAILDGVADLERCGLRAEAHAVRRDATAAYSGAWGEAGRRRLTALVARIEVVLAAHRPMGEADRLASRVRPDGDAETSWSWSTHRKVAQPR